MRFVHLPKYNLRVIEDAAHAFGSSNKARLVGNFGGLLVLV